MLRRLEAEMMLKAANLRFATTGQVMEDLDRTRFLSDLQTQAAPVRLATLEEIEDAGIPIVYEHEDKDGTVRRSKGPKGRELLLPPGVEV